MRHAFSFDASACTGCKACQVACKDRHALGDGVLWRRVYEVSGGTWERRGAAWTNSVFAYNLSVGCNHCADPACAAACPTDAYSVRDDGVVWLDSRKCVGCGYCAWACPYGAPQYSVQSGRMTKCDLCRDLIDEGLPPACVAACPMRALDIAEARGEAETRSEAETQRRDPFPLPDASRTQPALVVIPHRAMGNPLPKTVANVEEVRPVAPSRTRELPLVAFTLLAQAAAGASVIALFVQLPSRTLLGIAGLLIAVAGLVSLLHLGRPFGAWRATVNAKRSPLSREIVMLGIFAAAWVLAVFAPAAGRVALAIAGAGLVYSMADVYRLDSVPGWKRWRTGAAFALSAVLLGAFVVAAMRFVPRGVPVWLFAAAGLALLAQQISSRHNFYGRLRAKVM